MEKINQIEVKSFTECKGFCEACVCNGNKMITFEASFYHETDKAVNAYYQKNGKTGFMGREWFPKKLCEFGEKNELSRFTITAPLWLLQEKKIYHLITQTPCQ